MPCRSPGRPDGGSRRRGDDGRLPGWSGVRSSTRRRSPPAFKSPAPAGDGEVAAIPPEWWRVYQDARLDELITAANASNQTLRQAIARVDEARALARVAASFRYPAISLDPTVSRQRLSGRPRQLSHRRAVRRPGRHHRLAGAGRFDL